MINSNEIYKIEATVDIYSPQVAELSYSYRIPNPEEVCIIQKFLYDKKTERIEPRELDKTCAKNIRMKMARALLLRSAILAYNSDAYACVDTLKITGFLSFYDRAYGNTQRVDVIKVTITRDIIRQLNPEKLSLAELFEKVLKEKVDKGLYVNRPYEHKK